MKTEFYEKYKDTYFSDCILKSVFEQDITKHSLRNITKMSYKEIVDMNVCLMKDFLNLFVKEMKEYDKNQIFRMVNSFYIDPDSADTKFVDDVICTVDAVISLNRLFKHESSLQNVISGYEKYRKTPIFYFPKQSLGINTSRLKVFGDRIDCTLFDIKRYFDAKTEEEKNTCKLINAYNLPKTQKWLCSMGSFDKVVDWFGVKNIFTDDNYNVLDIEKNDGSIISDYMTVYKKEWSNDYYNFAKKKIDAFMFCEK